MQIGLGGAFYIVAVILFILAAIPFAEWNGRLSTVGLAFFALGHLL